ncbi:MAG TPA: phenylacetate-CoA oxygenase subunit PaaI [Bacteroidetes bacterium]|nr:phenylacetate-CoA oxygenase subunit PaaI [Bacteroidota bacterium]
MSTELSSHEFGGALQRFVLALADDELVLGHRDSEWTGHAPILEEDIAFSNIAQDEIGHALVWFTLYEQLAGVSPDSMGFERSWEKFTCCRFVSYPKGDFAYTVIRQYLFDVAEIVRLGSLLQSSNHALKEIAAKLSREESYHVLHTRSLVERLGDATEESHQRMQSALDVAFPQALGMFEALNDEEVLIRSGVFPGNRSLQDRWMSQVVPLLRSASLELPARVEGDGYTAACAADIGGRKGRHSDDLKQLVSAMQLVYQTAPDSKW